VGPRAVLDAVVKRKIPSPRRESKPRTPIVQPVAQRYTDWETSISEDLASFTLKMEVAWSSQTFSSYHRTTRLHNPEDLNLNLHHRENLRRSHLWMIFVA
jgi:hypothetical protein